jgi:tRNA threonylcarbamoyl adenosine modification protein YeaZ
MNILALDTSMGACSAAVLRSDGAKPKLFARQKLMERGHAEALMPMVAETMAEAALPFARLYLIAATTGPGSFTGVRIAIAAARGLALVTKAKLFGTDSLTVMALVAAEGVGGKPFAVAVDARRGMIYFALYDGARRRREGPFLLCPEDAARDLPADCDLAVGSGAGLLADVAARMGRPIDVRLPALQPSAEALAMIAFESGETSPTLRPLYLRAPDAKPQMPSLAVPR